jgi:hypothetical protein
VEEGLAGAHRGLSMVMRLGGVETNGGGPDG